ncbi:MAG: lytic transglycosylase domain-containing protein [Defluviitaleaceae bacterium]|nr:lytic transglycosylase domain-containing protein [Defluviitaleaceae bacterium]
MKKWVLLAMVILSIIAGLMAINIRFPVRYLDIVHEHTGDLEPALILAVIMAESSFRQGAESHRGAQGLMQLMPATAEDIAQQMGMTNFHPEDVWQPETNIAMGSFYLNRLVNLFDGNIDNALAAYNAGRGNVNRWLSDPDFSHDGENIHTIPFPETYNYLRRVHFNRRIYNIILTLTRRTNP